MLEVTFEEVGEGIYIQTHHDADLFNVARFRAKTKATQRVVRELLFDDDCVLVAHDAEDMQRLMDTFAQAATPFSLKINKKKMECLYQPAKNLSAAIHPTKMEIYRESPIQCKDFVYLGSTISDNARLENELTYRLGRASMAFGKLQDRLWKNHHFSTRVKCKVYHAVVPSSLLYGAEIWTIYRAQVNKK